MDRQQAEETIAAVERILRDAKLPLEIARVRGTYGETSVSVTVELAEEGGGRDAEMFKHMFAFPDRNGGGLRPEDLGATFKSYDQREYQIIGARGRATKRPILCKCEADGKTYCFATKAVEEHLRRARV